MNSILLYLTLTTVVLLAVGPIFCSPPAKTEAPSRIKNVHPRIFVDDTSLSRMHETINVEPTAKLAYTQLLEAGDEFLSKEPVKYTPDGDELEVSRTALKRLYTFGLLYQLTRDSKWVNGARREIDAICHFPSWNPKHWLDVAEMTHALAIAYDWFGDALSPSEAKLIRHTICHLGLAEGRKAIEENKEFWVTDHTSNWNAVCYGGLLIGALAVGGEDTESAELTAYLMPKCVDALRQDIAAFQPDGACVEGIGYWNYGTVYLVSAIAALQSATGSDCQLPEVSGLDRTGDFFMQSIGPTGKTFNFSDSVDTVRNSPQLFWLSSRYKQPVLAAEERNLIEHANNKRDARDLLWFSSLGNEALRTKLPLNARFEGPAALCMMRTGWRGDDTFIACKGGDNSCHHAHMDIGAFVLDALGQRWAEMPGMENYELPGYFSGSSTKSMRWHYYRTNAMGQNTIMFADGVQNGKGQGLFLQHSLVEGSPVNYVVYDLSSVYRGDRLDGQPGVTSWHRGFALLHGVHPKVMIEDDIAPCTPSALAWQMHTHADVAISGHEAVLHQGGKSMRLQVLSPEHVSIECADVNLPPPQYPTNGLRKLVIKPLDNAKNCRFLVIISEQSETPVTCPAAEIPVLDHWENLRTSPVVHAIEK